MLKYIHIIMDEYIHSIFKTWNLKNKYFCWRKFEVEKMIWIKDEQAMFLYCSSVFGVFN